VEKNKLKQLTTMGFVQVWLEVVAIGISNMAAFVRAGQTSLSISSYHLSLSKAKQRFRAEGILMPHLLQSPFVMHYVRFAVLCRADGTSHQ